ncbi:FadR/GntR family transcriptional regulator [Chitinophaga sp. GCM10012297]|uniref:FadR family transcriptional regulator n=1 Tax=Chitinophaga chungangae TaxID=2821488 RepID=A0ABS3YJ45_9BACT|nr:GntR family transcriptional regulator [Chitinophaga chungangae]MBO9154707.1 FadR family transcriptional regulator [Chitinophaga chungangae]
MNEELINDLSKNLGRVKANTMADDVEMKLRQYLKKMSLKPGDPLPKETDLAEALGVSRNVVREALSRLRMLGMIETRKRKGAVLASPDILLAFERVLDPLLIDDLTLRDIFELRLVLEMGLADLLYARMKDEDIDELEKIANNEINKDKSFLVKNEIAFHGKLYEMTGNGTLKRFQIMLLPIFAYVITRVDKPYSGKVDHRRLVDILRNGTKEDFKIGMYEHLKPHFDRL